MSQAIRLEIVKSSHAPVPTSRMTIAGRERLIVHYETPGTRAAAEAAPLEGFGDDSLSGSVASLSRLSAQQVERGAQWLTRCHRDRDGLQDVDVWRTLNESFETSSKSARFCFEALCARMAAQELGVDLFRLLGRPRHLELATSQVLDPLAKDLFELTNGMLRQGTKTFKLKCGRDPEREAHAIAALSSSLQGAAVLRIDANRSLTVEAAQNMIATVGAQSIQWFEDLTDDVQDWEKLRASGARLAVDEHLVQQGSRAAEQADVLILKPMALGGFGASFELFQWAESRMKQVCVSHLFDGPLAFEATAALAFSIHSAKGAAGLSRHPGLDQMEPGGFPWLLPGRMILPDAP